MRLVLSREASRERGNISLVREKVGPSMRGIPRDGMCTSSSSSSPSSTRVDITRTWQSAYSPSHSYSLSVTLTGFSRSLFYGRRRNTLRICTLWTQLLLYYGIQPVFVQWQVNNRSSVQKTSKVWLSSIFWQFFLYYMGSFACLMDFCYQVMDTVLQVMDTHVGTLFLGCWVFPLKIENTLSLYEITNTNFSNWCKRF